MTAKEEKIVELLRAGKSYTEIQTLLEVSPSKISQIKKEYLTSDSDDENTSDTTTFNTDSTTGSDSSIGSSSDSSSDNSSAGSNIGGKSINNNKNNTKMDNEKHYDPELNYSDKIALEKLKINLAHEAEMKRLENESSEQDLRWRELSLKERNTIALENSLKEKNASAGNLSLEEKKAEEERKKMEKQGKSLIFRFRKMTGKIIDGEWTKSECDNFLEHVSDLKEQIELYCFENDIETDGLRILEIIEKIEDEFVEIIDDDDDDDELYDLSFEELYDDIEEAKEIDFESYE